MAVATYSVPLRAQYPVAPNVVISTRSLTREPRVSGYLSVRETLRDDTLSFTLHRARLGLQALPAPFIALKLQTDLAAVGRSGGDTVPAFQVTDAFVQIAPTDTLIPIVRMLRPALLIGQARTPFSLEAMTSSSIIISANRSLGADRLSPRRDRGVFGYIDIPRLGAFSAAIVDGEGANRTSNPDGKQLAAGRLTLMPMTMLSVSGKWAGQGADHRWGYDARWMPGDAVLEGEIIEREGPTNATTSINARSAYVLAAYRVRPWLQPLVKWEQIHETLATTTTTAYSRSTWTTIGFNLLAPEDRARMQVNWIDRSDRPVSRKGELVVQLQAMF